MSDPLVPPLLGSLFPGMTIVALLIDQAKAYKQHTSDGTGNCGEAVLPNDQACRLSWWKLEVVSGPVQRAITD
ncbi:hypothetical protein BO82DRAFT_355683 [Aspergillus uvarum CBS 121591]|uniref:Uncharacterized protein n=1 Tax=Aspergillus uvarum CBS 121591 TaxID=1448315 RepID=A0A319C274_9EURO|nr:hypothetical protein BO82DRAFT_355683 [Aspergillus uvarum CBS 121591]PYH80106.1 hypothetical protein BO82DRAFT_355683 [Aspergillus uvarum CBS 121591]